MFYNKNVNAIKSTKINTTQKTGKGHNGQAYW